ncbi:MAG: hypothetical protein QM204_05295 [Bacillota bacterium]|nr:hypothetical protein [Bacillota bacterium]NLL26040.1 hypothetical protein [Erysipelotrichia bacterium]
MKKVSKILVNLTKVLLILILFLVVVFTISYQYIRKTNYDDQYLLNISEETIDPLEDCYYDSKEKTIVFKISDELISSHIKIDNLKRELKKYDLELINYGFDIETKEKEFCLYVKVLYKDFLPLDGYILFNYRVDDSIIVMDIIEAKIENCLTITLEKLQKSNFKTQYRFKYPTIEISQMITINRNYLIVDSYHNDTLIVKYNLFDYIYNYYKEMYENGDPSYYIYMTIEKYGLDKYVETNFPYVVLELENYGIEIR